MAGSAWQGLRRRLSLPYLFFVLDYPGPLQAIVPHLDIPAPVRHDD